MVKIETVIRDAEGQVQGGIDFYRSQGEQTILYQAWEHMASGPVWKQVACDPMAGDDFIQYLADCWSEYTIVDVKDNFR